MDRKLGDLYGGDVLGALVSADPRAARDRAASSLEYPLQHTTIKAHRVQSAASRDGRQPAHSH